MKNSCAGVHAQTAMAAFIDGLERGTLLRHKLKRLQDNHQLDLNQMIQLATEFVAADDDARGSFPATAVPTQARRNSSTKRKTTPEEKQTPDMVAMTFAGRGDGGQLAEDGELVVGSREEVKLPRQCSAFPKPMRSTAICRASYTSWSTVKPPTPIATTSSSTTSRRTRSPATSEV